MAQSFFIALQPINTVHTYAQVFGIISMPIIGITSANSTTGIQNAKLRTIVSHIQLKELSLFSFALLQNKTMIINPISANGIFRQIPHERGASALSYHMTPKQYRISMKIKLVPQLQNVPHPVSFSKIFCEYSSFSKSI